MRVNQQQYRTIWPNEALGIGFKTVSIIDQTKLPHVFKVVLISSLQQMIFSISTMQVRGAPLIGVAAAYGMALATQQDSSDCCLIQAFDQLMSSRPTAVNLKWALERMLKVLLPLPLDVRPQVAWIEAAKICEEDIVLNQSIGKHGLNLIKEIAVKNSGPVNILTHCNAGWLATVDFGTALAPVYAAYDAGISVHVWVDETRPRNQGASLTAWELKQHGVPHTVICDNAGGHLMQHGRVDMVVVGADRVSSNGDVCNKIGTYLKALAAFDNQIPFYVAVPSPTIDWSLKNGVGTIDIEERDAKEIAFMSGMLSNGEIAEINILLSGTKVENPAFDVTPGRLVTAIITEYGVFSPEQLYKVQHNI